jgi:hypothetical protein
MKTRILVLLFAILMAILLTASAASAQNLWCAVGRDRGRVLKAVALNGSAASRTFSFGPKICGKSAAVYRYLILDVEYTHTTSGNVLFTCTTGYNLSTANRTPQTCVGAGTCTALDGGIVSKAVTGSKNYVARLGLRGMRAWSCVASHDNTPAAGDIVTVHAYLTD